MTFDIPNAKFEQSELKKPKIKKKSLLSRIEAKLSHPLSSSNWQKKKLQKLSAQELTERNMVWVPTESIQTQDNDDGQAKGAMQLKKKRRSKRQYSNMRFAPNHQNYWQPIICLIYTCHICLCLGIHPQMCLAIPHILILILRCHMSLYIMEGYHQIVMHIAKIFSSQRCISFLDLYISLYLISAIHILMDEFNLEDILYSPWQHI